MKKSIIALSFIALCSTSAFAKDNDTAPVVQKEKDNKSERWYQLTPKTSIEVYGVIDIGYTYTSH